MQSASLLHSYNHLARHSPDLVSDKRVGVDSLSIMLAEDNPQRALEILAELVNFKTLRNAHIPCLHDTTTQQGQSLERLQTLCDGEHMYRIVVALARNRATGGLLRDLPTRLTELLNSLSVANKARLHAMLDAPQCRFLHNAGVNIEPTPPAPAPAASLLLAAGFHKLSHRDDPARHGTVLLYPQLHLPLDRAQNPDTIKRTARSQQLILDSLLQQRPMHVFDEGVTVDVHRPNNAVTKRVKNAFLGYRPGQKLTTEQETLLINGRAAMVYDCLDDSASRRGVCSRAEYNQSRQYIGTHGPRIWSTPVSNWTPEDQLHIVTGPEQRAMQAIQQHHSENPGDTVALVFGKEHHFAGLYDQSDYAPAFYRFQPTDQI